MVIGPVEFHTAGDPGAQRADEAGLDHMLTVEEVIIGGLVPGSKNTAADFRQNKNIQIFVLQMYDGIASFFLPDFPVYFQHSFIGIGAAGGTLMDPMLRKEGHFLLGRLRIGGNDQRFDADACVTHNGFLLYDLECGVVTF